MNRGASAPPFFFPPSSATITGRTPMTPVTSHQHISVRGDKQTVTEDFKLVTKHTRAGKNGKDIMCPVCGHVVRVHHFAWSALQCSNCKTMVDKYDYLVDQLDTWRTPR